MVEGRRLYTKYGDEGETSLLYGGRVSKANVPCEAYGATDETDFGAGVGSSAFAGRAGMRHSAGAGAGAFTVGAELATAPERYDTFKQYFTPLSEEMTARLEGLSTTTGGGDAAAVVHTAGSFGSVGAMDLARTSVRRAEREVVRLKDAGGLANGEILKYLNRVSDLLFILARYEDRELPLKKLTGDE